VTVNFQAGSRALVLNFSSAGDEGFGFYVDNGTLKTWINAGGTLYNHTIKSLNDGDTVILEAIYYSGEKIEFYVDDVLEYTETTHLPDTNAKGNQMYLDAYNGTEAADRVLQLEYWSAFQDW